MQLIIEQGKQRNIEKFGSLIGYIDSKYFLDLIPSLNIDKTNPRTPNGSSHIVSGIIETINTEPKLLPVMSKGILLALYGDIKNIEEDKNQNAIILDYDLGAEDGVLDGGHNLFAVGKYFIDKISEDIDISKVNTWKELQDSLTEHKDKLNEIIKDSRILLPIEILFDENQNNDEKREFFSKVSSARNTNIQLSRAALANYVGKFNYIKKLIGEEYSDRIIWQENDYDPGKRVVPVNLIIQIIWVILSYTKYNENPETRSEILEPQDIYKFPEECLKKFELILDRDCQDKHTNTNERRYFPNDPVLKSSFKLIKDLLEAYDYIVENYKSNYNQGGGKFGRLNFIEPERIINLPFSGREVFTSEAPFEIIFPIIFSLRNLIGFDENGTLSWIIRPIDYLSNKNEIGESYFSDLTRAIRSTYEANNDIEFIAASSSIYNTIGAKVNIHLDNLI